MDSAGKLSACIKAEDGTSLTPAQQLQLQEQLTAAVNRWNELLNEQPPSTAVTFPPWKQTKIEVSYSCEADPDLTVLVRPRIKTSYAEIAEHRINFRRTQLAKADLVLTHELGHLLGLGDTYSIPGYQTPVGQPPSLMSTNAGGELRFSDDDRAAIWYLWRYVVDGGEPCGPGYLNGGAKENKAGTIFCVPLEVS